jgi:alpha-soluble NSF attachment protein
MDFVLLSMLPLPGANFFVFCCVQDLVEAYEQADPEKFTEVIAEFDSMTRLDAWKTALLLRVKKKLTAIGEGGEEDLT